jgi:hypothetical protein
LASTPPNNEAFLREVDDELRRDQIMGYWTKWGRWLVGAVVLGLAAFGGYLWWDNAQKTQAGVEGEQLAAALDSIEVGGLTAAKTKLDALAASPNEGYRATAKITAAGLLLDKGDVKGAATAFGAVALDTTAPQPLRDLALVRQTAAEFDTMKPEAIVARLKPLAVPGNAWFGSAGEMVAMSYIKLGKTDLAGKLFGEIGKQESVPETIRSRAIQMAGVLGVDAVDPATKDKSQ